MSRDVWVLELRIENGSREVYGPYTQLQAERARDRVQAEVKQVTDRHGQAHHPLDVQGATVYPLERFDAFTSPAGLRRHLRNVAGERWQLSAPQLETLRLVAAGQVTWGDPYPARSARSAASAANREVSNIRGEDRKPAPTNPASYALPAFMVDGAEAYGGQIATLRSLIARGLAAEDFECTDSASAVPVVVTDAGRQALAAAEAAAGGPRR